MQLIKEKELTARQVETLVKKLLEDKQQQGQKAKQNPHNTAELRAIMDRLKVSLGMPVDIKVKVGKKVQGKMEIAFKNEEELAYLIEYLEAQGMGEVKGASPAHDESEDIGSISFHV